MSILARLNAEELNDLINAYRRARRRPDMEPTEALNDLLKDKALLLAAPKILDEGLRWRVVRHAMDSVKMTVPEDVIIDFIKRQMRR